MPTADMFHESITGAHPRLVTVDWILADWASVRIALVAFTLIVIGFTDFAHDELLCKRLNRYPNHRRRFLEANDDRLS